jgi:hypothetical protein
MLNTILPAKVMLYHLLYYMVDSDVAELVSWFLSAFGYGLTLAVLFRVFRIVTGFVR